MRNENMNIYERTLLMAIGGQLFSQAPNRQPRKVEIIMTKIRDKFREDAINDNEIYYNRVDTDKTYDFIKDLLFSIPEFEELNLSQIEFENNVGVHDENRGKYSFTSRYDIETSDSWKNDFIDLDAFVRNVYNNLIMITEFDEDCFCCVNTDTDKCNKCRINPKHENHYECSRTPKGKYTFACKFDCYRSRYICCDECDDVKTCEKKCTSKSESCGLAINKKGVKK